MVYSCKCLNEHTLALSQLSFKRPQQHSIPFVFNNSYTRNIHVTTHTKIHSCITGFRWSSQHTNCYTNRYLVCQPEAGATASFYDDGTND